MKFIVVAKPCEKRKNYTCIVNLVNFETKERLMIITTAETLPRKEIIEVLGIVRGSTVRARNVGRDIFAGLKNFVGGEISEYTKLQAHSREEALKRMMDDAEKLGAHAIINVRFSTSTITQGASEILAYGTAVKFEEK